MTVFVDASAFIAILTEEADWAGLADRLEADKLRLCSALSVWETVAALCRSYAMPAVAARADAARYVAAGGLRFVAIGEEESELAAGAYARFGKGRHPARLNMGDCFAYACAKSNGARLLFKGNDFDKTDIDAA